MIVRKLIEELKEDHAVLLKHLNEVQADNDINKVPNLMDLLLAHFSKEAMDFYPAVCARSYGYRVDKLKNEILFFVDSTESEIKYIRSNNLKRFFKIIPSIKRRIEMEEYVLFPGILANGDE